MNFREHFHPYRELALFPMFRVLESLISVKSASQSARFVLVNSRIDS